jgi:hypothetical protein
VLLTVGLGLRLYHYLRNPSMWHDEAALVLNVLGKSFTDLLGPLFFAEAAPPLFLWVEKAVSLLLGDGTFALRLMPFLASCASLLLLARVAQRVLQAPAVPWAVLLFACSDHLLWHACEAKPYAVDVLAATILVALFCLAPSWPLERRLTICALFAPVLIFLVYPGCFLYGGLLIALLPTVWQSRRRGVWLSYGLLAFAVFTTFAFLLAGPIHAQHCPAIAQCWEDTFPSWDQPWKVPLWTVVQTVEVFRYCCEPLGQALVPLAVVGSVSLWRRGRGPLVALLVVPVALALLASYAKAYPYGGSRVVVYATPACVLLIAEGGSALLARLSSEGLKGFVVGTTSSLAGACFARGVLLLLLLLPLGRAVQRVVFPWLRADCAAAAAYVWDNRLPGDAVAGNHWEYAYYFRNLEPPFVLLERGPHLFPNRFWMVTTAGTRQERVAIVDALAGGWRIVEEHEFPRSTVFLLSQVEAEGKKVSQDLYSSP